MNAKVSINIKKLYNNVEVLLNGKNSHNFRYTLEF